MYQDPEIYESPERFWPDRFIISEFGTKPQYRDDPGRRNTHTFGFGVRLLYIFLDHPVVANTLSRDEHARECTLLITRL